MLWNKRSFKTRDSLLTTAIPDTVISCNLTRFLNWIIIIRHSMLATQSYIWPMSQENKKKASCVSVGQENIEGKYRRWLLIVKIKCFMCSSLLSVNLAVRRFLDPNHYSVNFQGNKLCFNYWTFLPWNIIISVTDRHWHC